MIIFLQVLHFFVAFQLGFHLWSGSDYYTSFLRSFVRFWGAPEMYLCFLILDFVKFGVCMKLSSECLLVDLNWLVWTDFVVIWIGRWCSQLILIWWCSEPVVVLLCSFEGVPWIFYFFTFPKMSPDRSRSPPRGRRIRTSERASYRDAPYRKDRRSYKYDCFWIKLNYSLLYFDSSILILILDS